MESFLGKFHYRFHKEQSTGTCTKFKKGQKEVCSARTDLTPAAAAKVRTHVEGSSLVHTD